MLPPGPAQATGGLRITGNVTPSARNLIPLPNDSFTVNAFWLRHWQRVPLAGDRHPKFYNARHNFAEDLGFAPMLCLLCCCHGFVLYQLGSSVSTSAEHCLAVGIE